MIGMAAGLDAPAWLFFLVSVTAASRTGIARDIWISAGGAAIFATLLTLASPSALPMAERLAGLAFAIIAIGFAGFTLVSLRTLLGELEESRNELRTFTDSVPYLIWRGTPEGGVDFLNRRYTDLTGHDHDVAIAQKTWRQCIHEDDLPEYWSRRSYALETGTEFRAVFRLLHANGEYRWMSLIGRPVRAPGSDAVIRWYGGISDAHEEVLAQQKVAELMAVLENRVEERTEALAKSQERFSILWEISNITFAEQDFSEAVVILDRLKAEGVSDLASYFAQHPEVLRACIAAVRTVGVNPATARLMGFESLDEMLERPVATTAEDIELIMVKQLELCFYGRNDTEGNAVLIGKDGLRVPVFYSVHRLPDEHQLSSLVDLTLQQRAEEMRLAAQEQLARANRAATLGAFSVSLAHELNQPIGSMMIDAGIALRLTQGGEPAAQNLPRILERVSRTAERISGIVGRIRESISGRERAATQVDLCRLAQETAELLRRDVQQAQTTLDIDCSRGSALVSADRVDLQQVLVNLILNAAEAMADHEGERRVRVSITPSSEGIRVSVTDTGQGIPTNLLEKVFDPFFTTKAEGIGMGLLICSNAVARFGGVLQARNRPEGGAEFFFTLPPAEAESAAA
ncbi:PAS domain S-box-containing protein [Sphingomonas kyeonggiensis]|uniref:histidine kinase n=1 Tax=Sphingomonas kyeonggiensis TaxID=1268553 RepID=A0A7W6JR15_9SPHN|nr:PAS domain S-box-containing protein [Sphingomonas kyeonggiensis]